MSCGVGSRRGLDPTLLWLWSKLEDTAPFNQPGKPHIAMGAPLKKKKKKDKMSRNKNWSRRVPIVAQQVANPTSIYKDAGSIPGLVQSVKDLTLP